MIEVSLLSARLSAEQLQELSVQLTNSGRGPCTNIVLRLAWPREISLIQGSDRIEEARLDPGQSIARVLRVRPKQAGIWHLTSSNFSYRDPWGQSQRISNWSYQLVVEAAPAPPPKPSSPLPPKPINLILLRESMMAAFNVSELRTLCFELSIDDENLTLQNKADLVRELIVYCQRRNLLLKLVDHCRRHRSEVDW